MISQNSFVAAAELNPYQLILFSATVVTQVCGCNYLTDCQGKLMPRLDSQNRKKKECYSWKVK